MPIDTPYPHHAKNYLDVEPKHAPPVYAPETVARTILHCAQVPVRDVFVGASGKGIPLLSHFAPRVMDKAMEMVFAGQQKSHRPPRPREENGLDAPSGQLQECGGYEGHVAETSFYTHASLHPVLVGAVIGGVAAAAWWRASRNGATARRPEEHRRRLTVT